MILLFGNDKNMAQFNTIKIGKIGEKKGQKIDYQEIDSNLINLKNDDLLDAFTKVAILTILAGYKKCDYIFVDDEFNKNIDLKKLSRYLSYVLNHKELAPRKFNLKVTDNRNFETQTNPFVCFANAILKCSVKNQNFIYLCAHKDEMKHRRNTDKSKYFFAKASNLFSLESNKEMIVTTPFANISKTEILSYWKKHWIKKYKISPHDTTTCYYDRGCGKCEVCLKRTISLLAAGFDTDPFIKTHPMKDPSGFIVNKWIPQIKSRKFTRIKKLDFLIALEKSLDIVPKMVKKFYNNLPSQTLLSIKRRKDEINSAKI